MPLLRRFVAITLYFPHFLAANEHWHTHRSEILEKEAFCTNSPLLKIASDFSVKTTYHGADLSKPSEVRELIAHAEKARQQSERNNFGDSQRFLKMLLLTLYCRFLLYRTLEASISLLTMLVSNMCRLFKTSLRRNGTRLLPST